MVASPAAFAESLKQLPVLSPAQQAEVARDLQPRCPDAKALARQLLQRGWLTSFQVNQLFMGRGSDLVLGHYVLLERLGEGGTGQVYKARHQHMNRIVALKLIRKDLLTDREVVGRFQREIQLVSTLTHPHVVHAYDAGPVGTNYFLVMEFVEGTDLGRMVREKGQLPVAQACDYIRQAALGLQHIHERGLVHRDIKPSNLIVTPAGQVKILDLGLARLQQPVNGEPTRDLTNNNTQTLGTLDYLAPEQAIDFHSVDIRADIYSLGCSLYHLLAGQPPFQGGTLAQKLMKHQHAEPVPLESVRTNLPANVIAVVRRMMSKPREERFQTPGEVARLLTPGANVPAVVNTRPAQLVPVGQPVAAVPAAVAVEVIDVRTAPPSRQIARKVGALTWQGLRGGARLVGRHPRIAGAALLLFLVLIGGAWLIRGGNASATPDAPSAPAESMTYLSDLREMNFQGQAFGKDGHLGHTGNGNVGGKAETNRILVNGTLARKGISMLPPTGGAAQVQYRLGKRYSQLQADVGLHGKGWFAGSKVTFVLLGDGKVIWQSKPIGAHADYPLACAANVAGVDLLELQVTCTASNDGVWPVWIDPRLLK